MYLCRCGEPPCFRDVIYCIWTYLIISYSFIRTRQKRLDTPKVHTYWIKRSGASAIWSLVIATKLQGKIFHFIFMKSKCYYLLFFARISVFWVKAVIKNYKIITLTPLNISLLTLQSTPDHEGSEDLTEVSSELQEPEEPESDSQVCTYVCKYVCAYVPLYKSCRQVLLRAHTTPAYSS
jgi:hypothetical protein